jgi:hypothetical protein
MPKSKKKNKVVVAVESNPLEHVVFVLKNGSRKSLKVYLGHGEDLGKLFVQCDLCGTFISLGQKRSLSNMQFSDAIEVPEGLEERDSRKRGISDASQTSIASRQPSPSKKHR